MSIRQDRDNQAHWIECDSRECGKEQYLPDDDFRRALDIAKGDGWRVIREGAEWLHYCPRCSEPFE